MTFERYTAPDASGEKAYISFYNNGRINFSKKFIELYVTGKFAYLYYDGETDSMAFKFVKEYKEGCVKVRPNGVAGVGFRRANALDVEGKFDNIKTQLGMVIIKLGDSE